LRDLDAALAGQLPRLGATSRRLHAVALRRALKRALGS